MSEELMVAKSEAKYWENKYFETLRMLEQEKRRVYSLAEDVENLTRVCARLRREQAAHESVNMEHNLEQVRVMLGDLQEQKQYLKELDKSNLEQEVARLRTEVQDIRSELEQLQRPKLRPGTCVPVEQIRDREEWEQVIEALLIAGAKRSGECAADYDYDCWNYVGWDVDNGKVMHWDSPNTFGPGEKIITVQELLESV